MKISTPPNEKVIDEVWIGLSEDPDGKNGICAIILEGFGGTPMVTASERVLQVFRAKAPWCAQQTGKPIKIYKFTRAELVEAFEP
jgi:hypothetical protein